MNVNGTSDKEITTPEKETALIEAILYLESNPLKPDALNLISGLSEENVQTALKNLAERYASADSGLTLACINGAYLILPKNEFWEKLKDRYGKKNEGKISRAALETLTIVAYRQPITRSEIEALRGVSADTMIHLLLEKNLIREVGKRDTPGKPVQYGTTKEFLSKVNLSSIAELPRLGDSEADRFELDGDA